MISFGTLFTISLNIITKCSMNHFLDIKNLKNDELIAILRYGRFLKSERQGGITTFSLNRNHNLLLLFSKQSTRTRISFEAAMSQLGGSAFYMDYTASQISNGESIRDTSSVASRYVDLIAIRCHSHDELLEYAKYSTVPVINALTNRSHPCQVLCDIMTIEEHFDRVIDDNIQIAWFGDNNNMLTSWIEAAEKLNFSLNISTPSDIKPENLSSDSSIVWYENPIEAAKNSNVLITDTWNSMGIEQDYVDKLKNYQINVELMSYAHKDAIFMHCMPLYRGNEVSAEIADGPSSIIYNQAENRLHIQKSIILWCLGRISMK